MEMMIDSGSSLNVIGEVEWSNILLKMDRGEAFIYDIDYDSRDIAMSFAGNKPLSILCTFRAWLDVTEAKKPSSFEKFHVIKNGRAIISMAAAKRMKMLTIGLEVYEITLKEKCSFPSMPQTLIDFDIDESVSPVNSAYCNIPAAYTEAAEVRLSEMERQDIIEKVTESPKWISGLSAVPKGKSDFRLVVNMKGPNRAIRRTFHKLPTIDDIRHKLSGARFFSKLDLTSAFHHIKLGKESRKLTTFMGPRGMYRYKRLVFGVNVAPEIFQREMERVLQGIDGVIVYIDDILIFAQTLLELKEITQQVLDALAANNLTLNKEKCEYAKEKLTFLGHEISANGMNIDKTKVKDIENFREPRTVSELKSFLGLASYVGSYVPKFADVTAPLRRAIVGGTLVWEEEQKQAFEMTKNKIVHSTITQGFFSNTDATLLYTDASPEAVGAVLTQRNDLGVERIISFASKALTKTEKAYAQTQREALGIVWGVEHFYFYLLGRRFVIRTDAQGVACIFRQAKNQAKRAISRAESWALRLSPYDFTVEFIKGEVNIADPSSRLYVGRDEEYQEGIWPGQIATISHSVHEVGFDENHLTPAELKFRTKRDRELEAVARALENDSWPKELGKYKHVKDSLWMMDGILMKSNATVVPRMLRAKALVIAHMGHPGSTKMKSVLKERVWWPGISRQVDDWVQSCRPCTITGKRNKPVPMARAVLPDAPWQNLAIDFNGPYARYGGVMILVMVDAYSRYLIAKPVRSTDFASNKPLFDDIFDTHGYPAAIKSDNGAPFPGEEYLSYCASRGILAQKSTPLDPQQNGQVERYMQIVNKAIQIAMETKGCYKLALKEAVTAHNSATHSVTGAVPEEIMFGRKLRRGLPLIGSSATIVDDDGIRQRDWSQKMIAKEREDLKRGAKNTAISVGDRVIMARHTRLKGDAPFAGKEFSVTGKERGRLTLTADDGQSFDRNVTQVKKLFNRAPQYIEENSTPQNEESNVSASDDIGLNQTARSGVRPVEENAPRERRHATKPIRFEDYVMSLLTQ